MSTDTLTGQQVSDEALDGWALLLNGLQTRIPTGTYRTGLALVAAIGEAAEAMNHHPDVDLRYGHLDVRLTSHDAGGVTVRDVRLARTISSLAADAGVRPTTEGVARLELALDSPDAASVLPFWAAVLAVEHQPGLPLVWFQDSGSEEPRQRWHPDVWVDPAEVQPRIEAALAAGGTLVSDAEAPSFWVLADAQGNNVCLCTWQDRG